MAQREDQRDSKSMKKDRQGAEQLRREIDEQSGPGTARAQQRDHNRDAARGDWDRTGRHHDEGTGRDEIEQPERPEDLYSDKE